MPNNKKNKRGDRGSLEETPKDVKRPNLDATEESQSTEQLQDEDNMADEEKEPTLSKIRDMLRDLQKSVAEILKENNNLKEELSQIKSSFQSQGREISKLKETLTKVTNENVSLVSQLEQARKKLRDQEEETTRLWAEQDELEQYSRKNSLEIHGLPENVYSSTEEAVLKLAGALNVEVSALVMLKSRISSEEREKLSSSPNSSVIRLKQDYTRKERN